MTELAVVIGVSSILALVLSVLIVTTFRVYNQEMQQNGMNLRGRQLVSTFALDADVADQLVWASSAAYSPPAGPTYTYPVSGGSSQTSVPAGSKVVVFRLPSYNSNGVIATSWDYVGYTWTQGSGSNPGTIRRTSIVTSGSSRSAVCAMIPEGGDYDTAISYEAHIATTAAAAADSTYDPFGTVPAGARIQDVDFVRLTCTFSIPGSSGPSVSLSSGMKLRSWRQS